MNGDTAGAVNVGSSAARYRNAAICSRSTGADGSNRLPAAVRYPVEMPSEANQVISL